MEEMLAAEQSGAFQYKGVSSTSEIDEMSTKTIIDRLYDLSMSNVKENISLSKSITSTVKQEVPEKVTTKPASSSRPLTMDDDDLDIDLEIDDNIDTTVSMALFVIFLK